MADSREAAILFREQERSHEARRVEYERKRDWMKTEWGDDVQPVQLTALQQLRRGTHGYYLRARLCGVVRLGG